MQKKYLHHIIFFVQILCIQCLSDPYKTLGISRNADQQTIKQAFKSLSRKYHPDKNKEKSSQQKYTQIVNAYEILKDPQSKQDYDNGRSDNRRQNGQQYQQRYTYRSHNGYGQQYNGDDFDDIIFQFMNNQQQQRKQYHQKQRQRQNYQYENQENQTDVFEQVKDIFKILIIVFTIFLSFLIQSLMS